MYYLEVLKKRGELQGDALTLVGYGVNERVGPQRFLYPGYRQQGDASVQGLSRDWLLVGPAQRATGGSGLCLGDSGSPQFLGESDLVVSIFSRDTLTCRGTAAAQRLDTTAARDFLAPFV